MNPFFSSIPFFADPSKEGVQPESEAVELLAVKKDENGGAYVEKNSEPEEDLVGDFFCLVPEKMLGEESAGPAPEKVPEKKVFFRDPAQLFLGQNLVRAVEEKGKK